VAAVTRAWSLIVADFREAELAEKLAQASPRIVDAEHRDPTAFQSMRAGPVKASFCAFGRADLQKPCRIREHDGFVHTYKL